MGSCYCKKKVNLADWIFDILSLFYFTECEINRMVMT